MRRQKAHKDIMSRSSTPPKFYSSLRRPRGLPDLLLAEHYLPLIAVGRAALLDADVLHTTNSSIPHALPPPHFRAYHALTAIGLMFPGRDPEHRLVELYLDACCPNGTCLLPTGTRRRPRETAGLFWEIPAIWQDGLLSRSVARSCHDPFVPASSAGSGFVLAEHVYLGSHF